MYVYIGSTYTRKPQNIFEIEHCQSDLEKKGAKLSIDTCILFQNRGAENEKKGWFLAIWELAIDG